MQQRRRQEANEAKNSKVPHININSSNHNGALVLFEEQRGQHHGRW